MSPIRSHKCADHDALNRLHASWIARMRNGDVEGVLELLDDDYVLLPNGGNPISRAAIGEMLKATLVATSVESRFECEFRLVDGGLAVEYGLDVQTVRPKDGSQEKSGRSRAMLVSRRGQDGVWRF